MKKVFVGLLILTMIALGAIAYAHGPGGLYGGYHMGPGHGHSYNMIEPGYSGHMRGWTGNYDQKFLDETADVRKGLNNKQFEYSEAVRNPNTKPETITQLEKEIRELQDRLYAKAPQGTNRGFVMPCWQF